MTDADERVPSALRSTMRDRLRSLSCQRDVTILWAVESGSRAWGFPSPDSDYDCRFLYVRPLRDYLTPWPRRDTITCPIEAEFDIAGWDLGKGLALLLKGNAVLLEWLNSPIVYAGDHDLRRRLLALADLYPNRAAMRHHYLRLGERQAALHLSTDRVSIKRLFYVFRPAAALLWMARHSTSSPPMRLHDVLTQSDAPAAIQSIALDLIERKQSALELEPVSPPPALIQWITEQFGAARADLPLTIPSSQEAIVAAETLFQDVVLQAERTTGTALAVGKAGGGQ